MGSYLTAGVAAICLLLGLGGGWEINGWRLNGKIDTLSAEYAKANQVQEEKARATETTWSTKLSQVGTDAKTKTDSITAERDAALLQLRKRPARSAAPSATNPTIASQCSGSSGIELSGEDAEFLTREAARADAYASQVNDLIDAYNALRSVQAPIMQSK